MSDHVQCLPSNPDISGIGIRTAVYAQNLLSFIPTLFALRDKRVTPLELDSSETQSTTILITAFAILLSTIVQALKRGGLTNYHAAIILNLSWMNNTNLFIYILLYTCHITELRDEEIKKGGREAGGQQSIRSFWAGSIQNGKAWRNPVFIIGSAHLSLMSAVGLWVWQQPVAFGDSHFCSLAASLVVVGQVVPIGSRALREWSLLIYSLLLLPVLNLIIPICFFAAPIWVYSLFANTFTFNRHTAIYFARGGLVVLATINILLLADIEAAISKNKPVTDDGDAEWTFGQTLALLLLLIPIRDITEAVSERRAKRLDKKLLEAAKKGELQTVRDAIESGASKAGIDRALRCAFENGHLEIVEFLIKLDVNAKDSDGRTALHFAAEKGYLQLVEILAKYKPDVNTRDHHGQTALHLAVKNGQLELVKYLLVNLEADANAKNNDDGQTALQSAAQNGDMTLVKILAQAGADVNMKDDTGWTALHYAANFGHANVAKLLVELKADVTTKDNNGETALHYAEIHSSREIVDLLRGASHC